MIFSVCLLNNSLIAHKKAQKSEHFSVIDGDKNSYSLIWVIVGLIFLAMELALLYYAINMAMECSRPGPERIINVILALMFTMPYVLLNTLFNKCFKAKLSNPSTSWLPSGMPLAT
jgi:hypothetical protein